MKSAQQSSPQTSQKVTISCPQLMKKDYKYGTSGTAFYINIKDAPAYYYYYKFWKTKIGSFSGSYFNGNIENTGKVKLKSIKTPTASVSDFKYPKCTYEFNFDGLPIETFDISTGYIVPLEGQSVENCSVAGKDSFTCDLVQGQQTSSSVGPKNK